MKIRHRLAGVAVMVSILGCTFPAWAGEWIQEESGQWVYEENQELLKGWNRIDGIWYCLDTETGVWIEKPSMTSEAACRLLEISFWRWECTRTKKNPCSLRWIMRIIKWSRFQLDMRISRMCSTGSIHMR